MKARSRYLILSGAVLLLMITLIQLVRVLFTTSASSLFEPTWNGKENETKSTEDPVWTSFASYLDDHRSNPITIKLNIEKDEQTESVWKQVPLGNLQSINSNGLFPSRRHARFASNCRMFNCFDFNRCAVNDRLRVHIYPPLSASAGNTDHVSEPFLRILTTIEQSPYFEPDPDRACVFVSSIDLLDRDPLSADFRSHVPRSFLRNEGRNHLLFNLYSGTWPSYDELDFAGFDAGYAILVKASFGLRNFRPGFDISYPLYGKSHPYYEPTDLNSGSTSTGPPFGGPASNAGNSLMSNAAAPQSGQTNMEPLASITSPLDVRILDQRNMTSATEMRHLLVFKGTRYVTGQGSDVRDALPLLHNGQDVHILTNCRKSRSPADQRCSVSAEDEQTYTATDYDRLMRNSTFCLVPRGRRLGSFRFLEALKANCIPVLLSDEWLLPLHDVLDWSEAVIRPDQRTLLRLPDMLRSIGWLRVQRMRAAGARLYHTYLSSIQQTVMSVLHLLEQRIHSTIATRTFLWSGRLPLSSYLATNSPGESCERDLPPFRVRSPRDCNPVSKTNSIWSQKFTALVFVSQPLAPRLLLRLLRNLAKARHLHQSVIIWALPVEPPASLLTDRRSIRSILIRSTDRFPMQYVHTDCVLTLDADSSLLPEELDFAYRAWQSLPSRLVGFSARAHVYDEHRFRFAYSSRWANHFSIILLDAAFFHRWYAVAFARHVRLLAAQFERTGNHSSFTHSPLSWYKSNSGTGGGVCTDLHFNFLVALLSRQPPIKLTQRKRTTGAPAPLPVASGSDAFGASQRCFQLLANQTFAHIPLRNSQARLDPLLFKDPVSALRKRYRRLEQVL